MMAVYEFDDSRFEDLGYEISGDDIYYTVTITDEDGDPYDITDWVFWMTIKEAPSDADTDALFQEEVTSHTNPTQGETEFNIPESESKNIIGKKCYDIQFKDNDGDIVTFLHGKIEFKKEITQEI